MRRVGSRWVILDVGETLIDETRIWSAWADELGISRMTLMAAFGAIVVRGQQYADISTYFPMDDWNAHHIAVDRAGQGALLRDRAGRILLLRKHGAEATHKAVHGAVRNGHAEVVKILLEHCAKRNLPKSLIGQKS